ncbi:histidine phosphatase family protein [Paenibacillus pasadenensis]|uniref:histidine phosphatase family protein n=1 Tax=Paenibacillus pasadenensis TaxID=217090 RepID=UPI00048DBE26|nr:histidine phosphatase family protein [Paenibacillus pasadenensis]
MKTTFFLVRHAVKEKAMGDVGLTSEGIEQAQLTAVHLSRFPIDAVRTSPLQRAKQTAQHIASMTGAKLAEDNRLRERVNWGDAPGQTFEQFIEMWNRCTNEPDYRPEAGDSAKEAGARLASALSTLSEQSPPGSHIVVVTHGGIMTDFSVHFLPQNDLELWHPHFVSKQSELIPECSITTLIIENGECRIEDFASVVHLKAKNGR